MTFLIFRFSDRLHESTLGETEETARIWSRLLTSGKTPESIQESINARRGSSLFGASANFVKGMMGAGLLSLPNAFYISGLITGIVAFIFTLILCTMACVLIIMVFSYIQITLV